MRKLKTVARPFWSGRQPRVTLMLLAGVIASAALVLSARGAINEAADLAAEPAPAQSVPAGQTMQANRSALSGQWVAQFNPTKPAVINLLFTRRSEDGGSYMSGKDVSLSELQGFPSDVNSAAKININFRIVREAGTFDCEGYFSAGKGAGFWTLTPSQSFISAMRGRGYDNLSEEDLLRAAMHNLTTKVIEDLKTAGYDRLEFRELLRAMTHEVTPAYIREMQVAGYQGLSMEELVRARNHDVDGQYVKEVQAMGFDKQPLESLIRLRNHEITQAFINQMRSIGFDNLSIEELIRLKNHEITPDYVNGIKAEGYSGISADVAIHLKNHEIDQDYIRRVKAKGFTNVTLDQLVRLRSHDIVK